MIPSPTRLDEDDCATDNDVYVCSLILLVLHASGQMFDLLLSVNI